MPIFLVVISKNEDSVTSLSKVVHITKSRVRWGDGLNFENFVLSET